MGTVNIGAFRHKITFLKAINRKGNVSQLQKTYVPVSSVFADVQVQPTIESVIEGNLVFLEKIHVVAYSSREINTNCVIRWDGSEYNVTSVIHDRVTHLILTFG